MPDLSCIRGTHDPVKGQAHPLHFQQELQKQGETPLYLQGKALSGDVIIQITPNLTPPCSFANSMTPKSRCGAVERPPAPGLKTSNSLTKCTDST